MTNSSPKPESKMISPEQLAALKPLPVAKVQKLQLPNMDNYKKAESEKTGKQVLETKDYKIEYDLVNGLKQGLIKFITHDGKVEMQFNYVDDILEGEGIIYYQNGKVERTIEFKKGQMEGVMNVFYQGGQTWMELPFKGGKMDGEANFYSRKGDLDSVSTYKKNLLYGKQTIYVKGKEYAKKYYIDGEEVGTIEYLNDHNHEDD